MIRQVTDDDWKKLIDYLKMGTFLEAIPVNHNDVIEAEDETTFSDAQTMIKVRLTNSNNTDDYIDVFFVFSNSGLVNLIMDNKIAQEQANDINLYYIFPEAADINSSFFGLMTAKFGNDYANRIIHNCDINIARARHLNKQIKSNILELDSYKKELTKPSKDIIPNISNNLKLFLHEEYKNIQDNTTQTINPYLKEEYLQYIEKSLKAYNEEQDHLERYIEIQNTYIDMFIEAYRMEIEQKEQEYEYKRSQIKVTHSNPNIIPSKDNSDKIRSKLTILTNDSDDDNFLC